METTKNAVALTTEENSTLFAFIGKAVMENVSFPSSNYGVENNTVQNIVNKTTEQLDAYGAFLEKTFLSTGTRFGKDKSKKTFGSITIDELVTFIELLVKHKEFETEKVAKEKRLLALKNKRNSLKTEEELRLELDEQIKALES